MLQDHPVNDRELKEMGLHGERRHQRAATNRRRRGRRHGPAPGRRRPGRCRPRLRLSALGPRERGYPGSQHGPRFAGEPSPGRRATPGRGETHLPIGLPRNATSGAGVTSKQANAPGPGGHGRGRSHLGRKRPRGPHSRGRSSRVALAKAFAGLRRHIDSEPRFSDALCQAGGDRLPRLTLGPPLWLRGSTAPWLPRPPGLARGRLQARAGGSAGGAKRRPPALVNRLLESSAEADATVTSTWGG